MYSNGKQKILAIDYDDVFTENPEGFIQLAKSFKSLGWFVAIVTGRHSTDFKDMPKTVFETFDDIIFCNGKAKCDVIDADIWVEDTPEVLLFSFRDGEFEVGERLKNIISKKDTI